MNPKTILTKIHFLDGVILEQEVHHVPMCGGTGGTLSEGESVRLFLEHTPWLKLEGDEYRPASQVARVTWENPYA